MLHRDRAVLFDLDDTLYPRRRFLLSGFAAVARQVAERTGVNAGQAYRAMVSAHRGAGRGRELDALIQEFGLPFSIADLVGIIRTHAPAMQLQPHVVRALRQMRAGWRIGVVTNGLPSTQAMKVAALGIAGLVDTVVYAQAFGSGAGKPEPEPFLEALRRLQVRPSQAVFVGDDERADIQGASGCGLRTIRTCQWRREGGKPLRTAADAVIDVVSDVPAVAERVLVRGRVHAA